MLLEHSHTTFNALSQNFRSLATSNSMDNLHCVVSGAGEQISLVTPYLRSGLQSGVSKVFTDKATNITREVRIPLNYTFLRLDSIRQHDSTKLDVITLDLSPGDCVYIPVKWWFQIRTLSSISSKTDRIPSQQSRQRELSISLDFWYEPHSVMINNFFEGVEW